MKSSWRADVAWGLREALLLTAICFVPAALYVATSPRELPQFVVYLTSYLAFALVAGVVLGLNRQRVRRRGGAMIVGALIGAMGLSALLSLPEDGTRDWTTAVIAIVLGGTIGSAAGSYFWGQARRRGEID